MNIIRSGANQVSYLFNERLLPALSAQQQKLGTITTVGLRALLFLVGCLACHVYWNLMKKVEPVIEGMIDMQLKKWFDELMVRGNEKVKKEEYEEALAIYDQALKVYPQEHQCYLQALSCRIEVLCQLDKEDALKECDHALASYSIENMSHWFILLRKADILNRLGRDVEAKELYNKIRTQCLKEASTQGAPQQKEALIVLAKANAALGKFNEAAAMGQQLIKLEPHNVERVFSTIECLEKDKNYKQALVVYEEAVARHPENILLLKGYADCLYRLKKFGEASIKYEKLLENPLLGADDEEGEVTKGEVQKAYETVLSAYAELLKESNKAEAANVYDKLADVCVTNKYLVKRYRGLANQLRSDSPAPSDLADVQVVESVAAELHLRLSRTDSKNLREEIEKIRKTSTVRIQDEKELLHQYTLKLTREEAAELQALLDAQGV